MEIEREKVQEYFNKIENAEIKYHWRFLGIDIYRCTIKYFKDSNGDAHIFYLFNKEVKYLNAKTKETLTVHLKKNSKFKIKKEYQREFWTLSQRACKFKKSNEELIKYDLDTWATADESLPTASLKIKNKEIVQCRIG